MGVHRSFCSQLILILTYIDPMASQILCIFHCSCQRYAQSLLVVSPLYLQLTRSLKTLPALLRVFAFSLSIAFQHKHGQGVVKVSYLLAFTVGELESQNIFNRQMI